MRCKECLPLLEEYFDGELETAISGRIAAHVSTCAECASVYTELQRDQEIYSHYRREMAATSAPWEVVRAGIEEQRAIISSLTLSAPPARLLIATLGIIRSLFSSRYALVPAFVIAVAIIVGLLMHFNKNANHLQLAWQPPNVESAGLAPKQADNISPIPARSPGLVAHGASGKRDETQVVYAGNRSPNSRTVSSVVSKRANDTENRTRLHSLELRREVGESSESASLGAKTDVRQPVRIIFAAHSNDDVSKHAKEAQALLRSFRNESATGKDEALDLGYERQLARNVLDRNILLRRDAENRRNLPVADLLGGLEPVLLDIANIEERASPDEVRAIVGRIERKGLVAKLQIHTARGAGPNFRNGSLDQN